MSEIETKPVAPAETEIHCQHCGELFLVPIGADGRPLRLLCCGCSGGGLAVRRRGVATIVPDAEG